MCALDAQDQVKKELGFEVLKKILRHYDDDWMTDEARMEIRLPVLFRCSLTGSLMYKMCYSIYICGNGRLEDIRRSHHHRLVLTI
jgi:hypothetical protein